MLSTTIQSHSMSAVPAGRRMNQEAFLACAAAPAETRLLLADGMVHGWSYLLDERWEPRVFWRGDLREPATLEANVGAPGQYLLTVGTGAGERWVCVGDDPSTPEGALQLLDLVEQLLLEKAT